MTMIRRMREEDVDAVRRVDAVAFGDWERQARGVVISMQPRTRTNVLACREKDPDGCFVAEEGGRLVGLVFSRTWGRVGWVGTFAVLPAWQRRGIGKRLLTASLEYLRGAMPCGSMIGLETMPESAYNLGLYLRQGFQARLPTFLLSRELEELPGRPAEPAHWSGASAETQTQWLADLQEATGQIEAGLDYRKEITSTARHGLGETLVLMQGTRAIGLSNLWLVSAQENGAEEVATIQVLALHPAHSNGETFQALLDASANLARMHGKEMLSVAVNARYAWALERLLAWGYRVKRTVVRMVLGGVDWGPAVDGLVDLCRWAG
jgi:ribosomal protein S18 acetylase RimI-like enzyme